MVSLADCAAVVVTRGDVDLSEIERSLAAFGEVAIWDNSEGEDLAVYGRYAALAEVESEVVYVQDDDVVLPRHSLDVLAAAYEPGILTANMPSLFRHAFYQEHCLVGFGAIFDRGLEERAFTQFALSSHRNGCIAWGAEGMDRGWFDRTCDIVFSALTPRRLVDVPYRDLPWASANNRMWKQREHIEERGRMLELVRLVRDA